MIRYTIVMNHATMMSGNADKQIGLALSYPDGKK